MWCPIFLLYIDLFWFFPQYWNFHDFDSIILINLWTLQYPKKSMITRLGLGFVLLKYFSKGKPVRPGPGWSGLRKLMGQAGREYKTVGPRQARPGSETVARSGPWLKHLPFSTFWLMQLVPEGLFAIEDVISRVLSRRNKILLSFDDINATY